MDNAQGILDVLQESFEYTNTTFCRVSQDVLKFEYDGEWCSYTFYVAKRGDSEFLITTSFVVDLSSHRRQTVLDKLYKLINRLHQDLPTGTLCHELSVDGTEDQICWFHKIVLTDGEENSLESVEMMLNEALEEVDEFYPSFQYVILVGVTIEEAYGKAIPVVYGHA